MPGRLGNQKGIMPNLVDGFCEKRKEMKQGSFRAVSKDGSIIGFIYRYKNGVYNTFSMNIYESFRRISFKTEKECREFIIKTSQETAR